MARRITGSSTIRMKSMPPIQAMAASRCAQRITDQISITGPPFPGAEAGARPLRRGAAKAAHDAAPDLAYLVDPEQVQSDGVDRRSDSNRDGDCNGPPRQIE